MIDLMKGEMRAVHKDERLFHLSVGDNALALPVTAGIAEATTKNFNEDAFTV